MTARRELSDLFAAERAVRPSADLAERGLVRLLEGLAAPAAVPVAAGAAQLSWVVVSKWVLGGLTLGIASSGVATAVFASGSSAERLEARTSTQQTPPQPVFVAPPPATPTLAYEPAAPASVEVTDRAAPRRAAKWPTAALAPPAAPRETFDAELRLINAAKAELDAGRPHAAKVWLGEHAARYPVGVFTTDREALRVLTACAERREPRLAEQFVLAHPTSPLSERLTRACEAPNSK
jgi:hypothetical protein